MLKSIQSKFNMILRRKFNLQFQKQL
jgi:hypothetical protein